jgi:hypothetical protein
MYFSFTEALRQIYATPSGGYANTVLYMAAETRPAGDYLLNTLLPNRNRPDYQARTGSMTIRTTMAGLVGMDSDYPEGGVIESTSFNEQLAKIAQKSSLNEAQLRELQQFVAARMLAAGGTVNQQAITTQMVTEALNFLDKIIVQAHMDTEEYLKGRALFTGQIDWTFNKKRLLVDYGIPTANKPAQRTGNDGYGGSTSKFWTDIRFHRKQQRTGIAAIIMHPDTADMIQYNAANNIVLVSDPTDMSQRIWRRINSNTNTFTSDSNDTVQVLTYGLEGEVYDLANPGKTLRIPFCPKGVVGSFGRNQSTQYMVGQGSTPPAVVELGYGHVGPTIEGGGQMGRWAQLYTPQDEPWRLVGRGAENFLPIIEDPTKIVLTTTEMV